MKEKNKVDVIITAAGNSTRYGKDKNLEKVNGDEILLYSIRVFDQNKYVDNIIITAKKSNLKKVEDLVKKSKCKKNIKVVLGGKTRKESVYNGLLKVDSDFVIIHDGARPIIKQRYINKCLENMDKYKGVTIGVKAKDTIKITNDEGIVEYSTKRENTWIIQTPQCFDKNVLLDMHEKYKSEEVTDDCMLLEKDNYEIKIIEGDYTNIKITTPEDLEIIKKYIKIEDIL